MPSASRPRDLDLDIGSWLTTRRFAARDFDLAGLKAVKGATTVTVVLPAREVAATIGGVLKRAVGPAGAAGLIDEVVVIDAASTDGTARIAAQAGATVLQQDEILGEHGPALGKGDAMWRAVAAIDTDIVCFLDADTADPSPDHLVGLLGPILSEPSIALVKGSFARPLQLAGRELPDEGGRVTELMARPLLNLHEPRLAGFAQPLAGEVAARRDLLEALPFPVGYGVEIAMLIDALRLRGLDALAESWLGTRRNDHQPLRRLGEMAYAVLAAVERRASEHPQADGRFVRPWADGEIVRVPITERPPLRTLQYPRPR